MPLNVARVISTELEKVRTKLPLMYEREDVWFSQIEKKNVEAISNRDMRLPLDLRPGGYFGMYDADGGNLGRGDGPTMAHGVINTNDYRYAVEYNRKAEWGTDTSRKAIVQTTKKLTANGMGEFRRAIDALYQTDGTGVLGTIVSFTGTGPYTLTCGGDGFGVKLLRFGQKVQIFNSTLSTNRTGATPRTITFYDLEAQQITIDGAAIAGIANGDKIVVEGASGTPSVSLYGLPYHASNASTGSWLGFDRATTPEVRANRVDAGGAALALSQPRVALNKIGNRLGRKAMKKMKACMHPCQKQSYEEIGQLVSVIQKKASAEGLDMYFGDMMQMAGATVDDMFIWNKKRIDFMDMSNWGRAELKGIDFYEVDGRKLFEVRASDGGLAAAILFYLVVSFNAFVDNPAELAYIDNLAIPAGYGS